METYNSIEVTRQLVKDGKISQEIAETIFPELKESEDERIRKHLIGVVELYYGNTDEQEKKDCLAWLEKQGSQNLANSAKSSKDLQEPVNEELEQASKEWLRPQLDKSYVGYGEKKMMELTHFDGYAMLDAIEFGAQWQKEQDQKELQLAEEHGILTGMNMEREQMMKDAIECNYRKARLASGHYLSDLTMADVSELNEVADRLQLRDKDKVKVIIIKE